VHAERHRPVRRQPLCPSCQARRSASARASHPDRYLRTRTSMSWNGSPRHGSGLGRQRPTSQPQSPGPAKPGHHGRRSGPNSASPAKPHSNASRAHPYVSQRKDLRAHLDTSHRGAPPSLGAGTAAPSPASHRTRDGRAADLTLGRLTTRGRPGRLGTAGIQRATGGAGWHAVRPATRTSTVSGMRWRVTGQLYGGGRGWCRRRRRGAQIVR